MRKIILLVFIAFALTAKPQEARLCRDSVIADFRHYVSLLEETHPDPYTAYGGRVFFRKAANDMEASLRKLADVSVAMLADSIKSFTACLHDGHTSVYYGNLDESAKRYAYIGFNVAKDGIFLIRIDKAHEDLLGARLDSINGVSVDALLERVSKMDGSENLYAGYVNLVYYAWNETFLKQLPQPVGNDSVQYSLTDKDGRKRQVVLPLLDGSGYTAIDKASYARVPEWNGYPSGYLEYKLADKRTMLFHVGSVMARENYEYCIRNGWNGAYGDIVRFIKNELKKEVPADTAQALAMIPSFSETFAEMLKQMKKSKAENLIIDLRGNGGGWTPITLPSMLMMYGNEYLKRDTGIKFVRRLSPLYLRKVHKTLAEWNKENDTNCAVGDFLFDDEETPSLEDFINNSMCFDTTKNLLRKLNGTPLFQPKHVYVVTDAYTFSAAFHYAYYLWRMGATVVGVPSGQAPNTFMERTPFTLPYTKLEGSISNSQQFCFSANDRRAKIFWPDMMPDMNDYKHYNFDIHTEILWLLDKIK